MPAIDNLLSRLGFVKLARYGLVLTPEGRIMSLRPAILDDGLGGRIVGWRDGDLAAMELRPWEPARPAAQAAVATRLAVSPPPRPLPKPAPPVVVAPAPVVRVAEPAQVDEDDWEWEIALARARVAAEEAEQAAASVRTRARLDTIPPPPARPLAVVKIPPRAPTEPLAILDDEDLTNPGSEIVAVARISDLPMERPLAAPIGVRKQPTQPLPTIARPPAAAPPLPAKPVPVAVIPPRAGTTPPTVIPIPKLPSIKDRHSQIQPVVSSAVPARPSRTRFAKGTGPVSGTHVGVAPPPPIRPAEDDKTSPGLPAVARTVALPSIKRLSR